MALKSLRYKSIGIYWWFLIFLLIIKSDFGAWRAIFVRVSLKLLLYININPSPSHQGAHLFLYIGLIIPIVQHGIIPVSMTRLKIFLEPWIYSEGNSFEDIHSRHYFSQKIYYFSITLIHIWYLSPSSRSLKFHHRLDSFYIVSYGLSISSSSS